MENHHIIIYEVRRIEVETKDGKNAHEVFNNSSNTTTELLKRFDTLEDARAFYKKVDVDVLEMSVGAGQYYLHIGKCIEENEYFIDEDGDLEWVNGGNWWDYNIPDAE